MAEALGDLLAPIILVVLGIFLAIAAYSRKPILLKLAVLGTFTIDPDSPGQRARAIMFGLGIILVLIGAGLVIFERVVSSGALAPGS